MFLFSVSKDMKYIYIYIYDKRRISTYLLENILTLIIKQLKIGVEQGTVVTTINLNKH